MKVIIFGATGMVGGGVLRECLLDSSVEQVLTVGRKATGQQDEKLREIVHGNLLDLSAIERELIGYDACRLPQSNLQDDHVGGGDLGQAESADDFCVRFGSGDGQH